MARSRGIEDYICFGQLTDAVIPDPEDCGAYFICDGGLGHRNYCHQGIHFNPILAQCDVDYKACNSSADPQVEQSTSSPLTSITGGPVPERPTTESALHNVTLTDASIAQKCPPNDTPNMTFLASHEYCDRFYLCYYGKPIKFDCSGGYFWSQAKTSCVPPQQSECQVRVAQYVTTGQ